MTVIGRRQALAAAMGVTISSRAMAQSGYPDHPIRLLVPAGAGGPTDVVARILQPRLSAILGQPVVIENKAGASGNIGGAKTLPEPIAAPAQGT